MLSSHGLKSLYAAQNIIKIRLPPKTANKGCPKKLPPKAAPKDCPRGLLQSPNPAQRMSKSKYFLPGPPFHQTNLQLWHFSPTKIQVFYE